MWVPASGTYRSPRLATFGTVPGPNLPSFAAYEADRLFFYRARISGRRLLRIPLLSNGEFVINAKAVRTFGRDTFEALNRGFAPPTARRFADGGPVGAVSALGGRGAPANIVIENHTGAEVTTERTQRGGVDIERIVIGAIKKDVTQNGEFARFMQRAYGLQQKPRGR